VANFVLVLFHVKHPEASAVGGDGAGRGAERDLTYCFKLLFLRRARSGRGDTWPAWRCETIRLRRKMAKQLKVEQGENRRVLNANHAFFQKAHGFSWFCTIFYNQKL
jgi:hypothetical protein